MSEVNKIKEFRDIGKVTKTVLNDSVMARDSVDYCYVLVCNRYNPDVLAKPFGLVMRNRKSYNVPSFESVSRAWRKQQEQNPELRGKYWDARHKIEEEVREWAVNG